MTIEQMTVEQKAKWLREIFAQVPDNKVLELGTGLWSDTTDFRTAPPKLRPWRQEEVPVPFVFKRKQGKSIFIAQEIGTYAVGLSTLVLRYSELLADYEHSTDGGKTWLPCGVEE